MLRDKIIVLIYRRQKLLDVINLLMYEHRSFHSTINRTDSLKDQ
jgi:hypothetical protein